MKKEHFAALLLLLMVSVNAKAQWSWLHPSPQGNNINKLSFLNSSTGWAAGDKGALIKTTNGGSSWALQYPGHIDDITELQFTDSLNGFMAAGSDLYYSSNSGTSWSIRYRFPSYIISALSMVDADSGVVALKNGSSMGQLFKTTDGGLSWQQILPNTPGDINDITLIANGNGMLVGTGALSMRTTDYGNTWSFVGIASAVEFIDLSMPSGQNIYIASAAQIFQSTDAGVTFTPIGNPAQTAGTNLLSIDFVNLNNGVVGSEAGNIFFTSDGGANWNNYLSNDWFNALDVSANTANNFIVAGTNGSLLKSTNGGTAWNELSSRVSETRLNGIETLSSTEAFAAGVSGTILHTTNSGVTWTPQASNAGGEDLHDILFVNATTGLAVGSSGTIVKTIDGGANWNFIFSGIGENLYNLHKTSGNKIYVCGANAKIAFSTNNGDTWTDVPNSFTGLGYDFKLIQSFGTDTLIISTNQPYLVTTYDNGLSWNLVNNGGATDNTAMYFRNSMTGFTGTSIGEIYSTVDGGTNWSLELQSNGNDPINCIQFTDPLNGWFFAGNEIYRTANGGSVWGKEINPSKAPLYDIDFLVGNNALAVGDGLSTILARKNDMQLSLPTNTFCTDNGYTLAINANGNWNPGNQFRIELSDEFGEFIYPTTLGSVTATGTTPVPINVPNGLIDGTDYRIRIFSTNPPMWSPLNSIPIEVRTSPDAYIVAGGPTAFCAGSSVTLYAFTGANWVYQWYKDGVLINGANADTLFVDSTGNYTVNVSDGICDLTSPITDVLVINCSGISEQLSASNYLLYPNPSKDIIRITSKDSRAINKMTITDITGRIIDVITPGDATAIQLNVESYPQGMYQVIIDGNKPAVLRFIKL
jgi:photosystem II stability/assembly factor-like uncharacterized protein